MVKENNIQQVIDSIKQSYNSSAWWTYLKPEFRNYLVWLLDNICEIGIEFRDSYYSLYNLEKKKREMLNISVPKAEPSPLFGTLLPEESYQSGIYPTKILMDFDAWEIPNDVEVNALNLLCQQIDTLESIGLLCRETKSCGGN